MVLVITHCICLPHMAITKAITGLELDYRTSWTGIELHIYVTGPANKGPSGHKMHHITKWYIF